MSTLLTKATTTALTLTTGSFLLAAPALADDATGAVVPAQLAEQIHTAGTGLAVLAGVVLLSKGIGAYRRSQWRRRWVQRQAPSSTVRLATGWSCGSITGRSPHPTIASLGASVARSATQL